MVSGTQAYVLGGACWNGGKYSITVVSTSHFSYDVHIFSLRALETNTFITARCTKGYFSLRKIW